MVGGQITAVATSSSLHLRAPPTYPDGLFFLTQYLPATALSGIP